MAESDSHIRLVSAIADWIANTYFSGDRAHIFMDSPGSNAQSKPPKIGEVFPDAFAKLPSGGIVIGEAKTSRDLENRHTEEQFSTYLRACSMNPQSVLVVGIPWPVAALAKSRLKAIKQRESLEGVNTVVLDGLRG